MDTTMNVSSDSLPVTRTEQAQVLIVGAGPAGLTTALSLARLGIRSVVLTRHAGLAHTPRAHITNQRTLEILAALGVEAQVTAAGRPLEDLPYNVFCLSLEGPEITRTTAWGAGPRDLARYHQASRHRPLNLFQHELEPILAEAAVGTGLVDLRFGHEFVSLEQDGDGVTATVLERRSGREYRVRPRYLVGADGAKSKVLKDIGLSLRGELDLVPQVSVWFKADLSRYVGHRPGTLYWGVDPDFAIWTLINAFDEWTAGWSIQEGCLPSEEEAIEVIRRSAGDPHLNVEIKNISAWTVNHAAADQYSVGRVFCMGDAVHQHPPTNGLGSNTSIADAYNLAWKLHLVLLGVADRSLLDTYSVERAPVGRQIVDRAFQSVRNVSTLAPLIGLRPDMTTEEKWERVRRLDDDTAEGAELRARLVKFRELMDPAFNALGVELGYRYEVASDPHGGRQELDDRGTVDDVTYVPSTAPGEHLPHVWVENSRHRISTVDLVGHGGFTLIIGRSGDGWLSAVDRAHAIYGLPIVVQAIGSATGYIDPMGEWEQVRDVEDSGCLLVRPDGHIAWRARTGPDPDALLNAIRRALGMRQDMPESNVERSLATQREPDLA